MKWRWQLRDHLRLLTREKLKASRPNIASQAKKRRRRIIETKKAVTRFLLLDNDLSNQ